MPKICCDCGAPISHQAKRRCKKCFNALGDRYEYRSLHNERDITLFRDMDTAFCAAMRAAIESGQEKLSSAEAKLDIQSSPCGPVIYHQPLYPFSMTGSSAGWMADMGDNVGCR